MSNLVWTSELGVFCVAASTPLEEGPSGHMCYAALLTCTRKVALGLRHKKGSGSEMELFNEKLKSFAGLQSVLV